MESSGGGAEVARIGGLINRFRYMSYCTRTLRPMRIAIFRFTKVVHPNVPSHPKRILHPLTDLPYLYLTTTAALTSLHTCLAHPTKCILHPLTVRILPLLTTAALIPTMCPFHLTCFRPIPLADHCCGSMTTLSHVPKSPPPPQTRFSPAGTCLLEAYTPRKRAPHQQSAPNELICIPDPSVVS